LVYKGNNKKDAPFKNIVAVKYNIEFLTNFDNQKPPFYL